MVDLQELWSLLRDLRPSSLEKSQRQPPATLTAAALRGNLELVRLFLERGADVNEKTRGFVSPLTAAARSGHLDVVDFLLAHGAEVRPENAAVTPLEAAVYGEHDRIVLRLLEAGAAKSAAEAERFSDQAARFAEGRMSAGNEGAKERSPRLAGSDSGRSVGEERRRRIERVCELIATAAPVAPVAALANPKAVLEGHTLLSAAAESGLLQVVEALIDAGVDIDVPTKANHSTAFMEAAREGYREIVERLLAAGADVEHRNRAGQTALMHAAEWGDPEIVGVLLAAGADPTASGSGGQTAATAARGMYSKEIKSLLRKAAKSGARDALAPAAATGLRIVGSPPPGDSRNARGALDFLRYARRGDSEWALMAVKAHCDDAARALNDTVRPQRWQRDVAEQYVAAASTYAWILQLARHGWTLYLRALGWTGVDEATAAVEAAAALSGVLHTRAISFVASDTSGTLGFRVYEQGALEEAFECEYGGALISFESRRRAEPEGLSGDPESVDCFFAQEGIYLPPCRSVSDGFQNWLEMELMPRAGVERLDFIAWD